MYYVPYVALLTYLPAYSTLITYTCPNLRHTMSITDAPGHHLVWWWQGMLILWLLEIHRGVWSTRIKYDAFTRYHQQCLVINVLCLPAQSIKPVLLCCRKGGLCNVGYPSETHLKPKSGEISFPHNLLISYPIVLKFCIEYDSDAVGLCAKCQNDWTTDNGNGCYGRTRFREIWV